MTKYRELMDLNSRKLLPCNSGGQLSKVKVSVGLVPSDICEEGICSSPSLWLADGSLLPISPCITVPSGNVCVQISPLFKATCHMGVGPAVTT